MIEAAARCADTLFIALDPASDQMADAARRATRRNLENVLFVQAAAEKLPPELVGAADRITINFPWGSLLKAVTAPDIGIVSAMARLGKYGAGVTMLVNMSVFDDAAYCHRMGLPRAPVLADLGRAKLAFDAAGLEVTSLVPDLRDLPYRTTWGQKLTRGTRRRVLRLDAVVR